MHVCETAACKYVETCIQVLEQVWPNEIGINYDKNWHIHMSKTYHSKR